MVATAGTKRLLTLVMVSAILQWLLGVVWYGVLLRRSWMKLAGFAPGERPQNRALSMGVSLVACIVLSFVLAPIVGWAGTFAGGAEIASVCWLGLIAPPLYMQHIFERRRVNLFAINAGYWLLAMALGGGVPGAFETLSIPKTVTSIVPPAQITLTWSNRRPHSGFGDLPALLLCRTSV